MSIKQKQNALFTIYVDLWETKYNRPAVKVNRFRDQWGFGDMITDLGYDRAIEVIKYYLRTNKVGHPLDQLFYNYDKYDRLMTEQAEDEVERTKLRAETKRRIEEMNGNE